MKILSITTSSKICAVAILENNQIINETILNNGLTHSETLMPIIEQILLKTSLTLNDIDFFAVDVGPGSFTGIRIGIATVKAFVDSLNKPAFGISSLEALSLNSESSEFVCCLIDAKKDNVYNQLFEFTNNKCTVKRKASFDNIDDLLLELQKIDSKHIITFIGDGAINYKNKITEALPNSKFTEKNDISAANVGLYSLQYLDNKDIQNLEPLYLRKTDAEQKHGKEISKN